MILGTCLHVAVRELDGSRTIDVVRRSPRNQLFRDRSAAGSFSFGKPNEDTNDSAEVKSGRPLLSAIHLCGLFSSPV
jgi:hypothetical protein